MPLFAARKHLSWHNSLTGCSVSKWMHRACNTPASVQEQAQKTKRFLASPKQTKTKEQRIAQLSLPHVRYVWIESIFPTSFLLFQPAGMKYPAGISAAGVNCCSLTHISAALIIYTRQRPSSPAFTAPPSTARDTRDTSRMLTLHDLYPWMKAERIISTEQMQMQLRISESNYEKQVVEIMIHQELNQMLGPVLHSVDLVTAVRTPLP